MARARLLLLLLLALTLAARAADVPYVTTPQAVVDAMLDIGGVTGDDYVIDLGAGDGRIVIAAAKQRGARGMGVEIDANLVNTARREAQRAGVQDRVSFVSDDLFFADLSKATVITIYLSEAVNQRLRPSLFKLKPGTRIVSHDFSMGNWLPDAGLTVPVPGKRYGPPRSEIYFWTVPADFSGMWGWRMPVNGVEENHQVALTQKFQRLAGKGAIAARPAAITQPEIRGDAIRFVMGDEAAGKTMRREFQGRIDGDIISGTAVTIAGPDAAAAKGVAVPWRATRSARGLVDIEAGAQSFGSGNFNKE